MIILSDRDKEILIHIETWGFATIKQIADIFFQRQKYGYDMARKRLNQMVDNKKLFRRKDYESNANIYTFEKNKAVRKSDVIALDFYAKLINEGAEVLLFELQYTGFMDGKIRPDIFSAIKIENWLIYFFVEIQTRHEKANIEKYERLYVTKQFQDKFQTTTFPTVVVIEDVIHKDPYNSDNFKIVQMDLNMSGFPKIFMPR